MRIIGGTHKSRKIIFPVHESVRPMMDRMRETLFNILGSTAEEADVLDLCAGSGSIGLEALSRGARFASFVDARPANAGVIKKNLQSLGLGDRAEVITEEADRAIERFSKDGMKFHIVFSDPPYNKGLMKKILLHLDQSDILQPLAWVVCHHSDKEELPEHLNSLVVERSKKIGQARLSFLIHKSV